MAVELVDGHAGEPHIDGSDAGIFKAGVCGEEGGILATSNKCACSINSNTSITIAEGELVMPTSGRLVRVKNPETLTITTGSASQKRNDLVVARYSKDSTTEIESVSLVVLRGTPTTGTPSDPATQVGDLKLYRLSLDGLTLQTPVKLANDIMPITKIQSRKQVGYSPVVWGGATFFVTAFYHEGLSQVEIVCEANNTVSWPAGGHYSPAAFVLPEQYRPRFFIEQACNAYSYLGISQGFSINKSGTVGLFVSASKAVPLFNSGQFSIFYSI